MERWKRLVYYLLINVVVSACTILTVLYFWDRFNQPEVITPVPLPPSAGTTAAPPHQPTATGTPLPTPTQAFTSYQVQPNDTLGSIAQRFEVTVEELLAVNDLADPDVLEVGQVLLIPIPPEEPPPEQAAETQPNAPAPTPTLPAGETSTPFPPGFDPQIEIVTVVGAGNLTDERVVIQLNGEAEISLLGWQLMDEDGNVYTFPQLTLFQDGAVTVFTRSGVNTVVELFWGLEDAVWETGETASLLDPQGNQWAQYTVP